MIDFLQRLFLILTNYSSELIQLIGFILSIGIGRLSAKWCLNRLRNHITHRWLVAILQPLVTYTCTAIWVGISIGLCGVYFGEYHIVSIGFQALFFVFFYTILKQLTTSWVVALSAVFLGIIPWVSYHFEGVRAFIQHIHQFSFQLGSVALTPVTIIKGVVAVIVLSWGSTVIVDWLKTQIKANYLLKPNTKALLSKIIEVVIYVITIVIGLSAFGIDLTVLTVVGGALGVGIGFGLQKITANFISGIILLVERSIETGDLVEMDNGIYGFVRLINARYTLIETFDGKEIMVPNEDFITNRVTNWTFSNAKGRIEIPVGVSYHADIQMAQSLLIEAAKSHPLCSQSSEPECFLREFGDSSVNFILHFFVDDVTQGRYKIQSDVMMTIWQLFKEHHIDIPFPQRDIHIKTGH